MGFYAVTIVEASGFEHQTLGARSTDSVDETLADPLPVATSGNGCMPANADVRIYIQYMDPRKWNLTTHAPNDYNAY